MVKQIIKENRYNDDGTLSDYANNIEEKNYDWLAHQEVVGTKTNIEFLIRSLENKEIDTEEVIKRLSGMKKSLEGADNKLEKMRGKNAYKM